jgi:hypothetical protein
MEQHYTPTEVAEKLGKDVSTIRDWFRNVPGVVKVASPSRREGKKLIRRYSSLLIPANVLEKWLAKRTNK